MWAMAMKELRQMRRDRRTLAMMILLPVLLLVVFGYAASFDVERVRTVVVGPLAQQVAGRLPDRLEVVETRADLGREDAVEALRDGEAVVAVVTGTDGGASILVDGADLFSARSVVTELRGRPELPAPAHPQVAAKDEASLEAEQQAVVVDLQRGQARRGCGRRAPRSARRSHGSGGTR